jgi:prophage regulatory protein
MTEVTSPMRMLTDADLRARGITWSRQHRHRKIRAGEFPRPVKIGAATNVWPEAEIEAWLRDPLAERDQRTGGPNTS